MNSKIAAGVTKLALLIDGDNVSATFMPLIWREAEKHGAVAVRRIYGQFKSGKMKSWQKHIADFDLMPVNVSPLTRGKNATDMKLVIEAMDMLYGRQLDGFCIASSDGDFTPLAARVRGNAIAVYGFGAKKAPAGYKAEFDRFYECDTMLAAEKKTAPKRASATGQKAAPAQKAATSPAAKAAPKRVAAPKSVPTPKAPQRSASVATAAREPIPEAAIMAAIDHAKASDGWSHQGTVGNVLSKTVPGFAAKKYGYKTMSSLIAAMPGVESKRVAGKGVFVRRK